MPLEKADKSGSLMPLVLVAVLFGAGALIVWLNMGDTEDELRACTMEAKLCPDGSYVGRVGPDCEFAPCPDDTGEEDPMRTHTDSEQGITFNYPHPFPADYISPREWPPQVSVTAAQFLCAVELQQIGMYNYCVQSESEGAAGSTFTSYTYTTEREGRMTTIEFTLQYTQCQNYGEAEQQACEDERASFAADDLANEIVRSVK